VNQSPDPDQPARPSLTTLFVVAAYGATASVVAYVVSRGNPFWMFVVLVIIGVAFRLVAYLRMRHHGHKRPAWWRWL
jgi:hypothetical protein